MTGIMHNVEIIMYDEHLYEVKVSIYTYLHTQMAIGARP